MQQDRTKQTHTNHTRNKTKGKTRQKKMKTEGKKEARAVSSVGHESRHSLCPLHLRSFSGSGAGRLPPTFRCHFLSPPVSFTASLSFRSVRSLTFPRSPICSILRRLQTALRRRFLLSSVPFYGEPFYRLFYLAVPFCLECAVLLKCGTTGGL